MLRSSKARLEMGSSRRPAAVQTGLFGLELGCLGFPTG